MEAVAAELRDKDYLARERATGLECQRHPSSLAEESKLSVAIVKAALENGEQWQEILSEPASILRAE